GSASDILRCAEVPPFSCPSVHRALDLSPTRRSSDLLSIEGQPCGFIGNNGPITPRGAAKAAQFIQLCDQSNTPNELGGLGGAARDRKSTRLNSSHVRISYAVSCMNKTKTVARSRSTP